MKDQKFLKYTVVFEPDPDGGFVAYVPALPGLVTEGETIEEAKKMAADAVAGYLAVLKEDGEEFPTEHAGAVVDEVKVHAPA